jgi:hypothetical protein
MSRTMPRPNVLLRAASASQQMSVYSAPAEQAVPAAQVLSLGWLPALSVVTAAGLLLMAAANYLAKSGAGAGTQIFWFSLLVIIVPITFRLLAAQPSRSERFGLVMVFGMALFLVKVMQSPFGFTYSDELVHLHNVHQILESSHLFLPNSILPASTLYPGLESFTAGLQQLSGLDAYSAGQVVIGAGRLILMAALFLLYERVTHSPRVAALASILYAGNANFLYFSVQFSYESLALPLALLVLYAVARREDLANAGERLGLTLLALIGICAVVVTHHLSSYFLASVLVLWTLMASRARITLFSLFGQWLVRFSASRLGQKLEPAFRRIVGAPAWPIHGQGAATGGPGGLALFASAAAMVWLVYVASFTLTYLSPVFGHALVSVIGLIGGESTGRQLFQSNSGYVAPAAERFVALGSVLLLLAALPFGLREVWRRRLHHPMVLVLSGAALAYFSTLGLRLVPSAWEIGNRASEFLFVGLALVTALARFPSIPAVSLWTRIMLSVRSNLAARWTRVGHKGSQVFSDPGQPGRRAGPMLPPARALQVPAKQRSRTWRRPRSEWQLRLALTLAMAGIFSGGVIAGWLPELRLAKLSRLEVSGQVLEPAGTVVSRWMLDQYGPMNIVGADEANGRSLLAYGRQHALAGRNPNIVGMLETDKLVDWQWELMRELGIEYMLVDRRRISDDNMLGYFFDRGPGRQPAEQALLPPAVYLKFDSLPSVSRELDSGNIAVYYVWKLVNGEAQR